MNFSDGFNQGMYDGCLLYTSFKEPITNYLVSNNNLKLVGVLYGKNTLYLSLIHI